MTGSTLSVLRDSSIDFVVDFQLINANFDLFLVWRARRR